MLTLSQGCQFRVLSGAVASGVTTLTYNFDVQESSKTFVPPLPGAGNINPTQAYTAPASPMGVYDYQNDGFNEVLVNVQLGAVTATAVVRVRLYQVDDILGTNPRLMDNVSYGAADITTSALAVLDSNKIVQLNVNRPTGRYMQVVIDRTVAAVAVDSVQVVLGQPQRAPVQQHSTVVATKVAFES